METDDNRKSIAERSVRFFASIGQARRDEQDRIIGHIEQMLYEAKQQETVDTLVSLARYVLDPPKK